MSYHLLMLSTVTSFTKCYPHSFQENEISFLAHHAVFKATNVQEAFKDNSTI